MFDEPVIENPNSSGQGYHEGSQNHPLGGVVRGFGYVYSHSTPVHMMGGCWEVFHTFKNGKHNVSLRSFSNSMNWSTSCGNASGREWTGTGRIELEHHLRSKRKRYIELKIKK